MSVERNKATAVVPFLLPSYAQMCDKIGRKRGCQARAKLLRVAAPPFWVKMISYPESFSIKSAVWRIDLGRQRLVCVCVLSRQSRLSSFRFRRTCCRFPACRQRWEEEMQAARPRRLPPPPPPPPTPNTHIHAPCSLVHPVHVFIKHSYRSVLEI